MLPAQLDNIFPFVVLAYGAIMTAVLHSPLMDLAETKLPADLTRRLVARRGLGLMCLAVGFAWSMQSLWFDA